MGYTVRLLALIALLGPIPPATNSFLELFAGEEAWSDGMRLLGYVGMSMDARRNIDYDILKPQGFLLAILSVMIMHAGAVALGGPPCSSWIFATRFSTGRFLDILGNVGSAYVRAQNALVARLVYILI